MFGPGERSRAASSGLGPLEVKVSFDRIRAVADIEEEFHRALFAARNHLFHYAMPGNGGSKKASSAAADIESDLIEGDRLAEFRAGFDNDVAVQFWGFAQDREDSASC